MSGGVELTAEQRKERAQQKRARRTAREEAVRMDEETRLVTPPQIPNFDLVTSNPEALMDQ